MKPKPKKNQTKLLKEFMEQSQKFNRLVALLWIRDCQKHGWDCSGMVNLLIEWENHPFITGK